MVDKILEIKDGIGAQAELPLQGGTCNPPSFEDLVQLYHAKYPGMKMTPAIVELGHALNRAESAYIEADPSFLSRIAEVYFKWCGLCDVMHKELGIGQQAMDLALFHLMLNKNNIK